VVQNARGAQNTAAAATGVGARLGEASGQFREKQAAARVARRHRLRKEPRPLAFLSNRWLHRVILALLGGIGCLLVAEGLLPERLPPLLPQLDMIAVVAGVLAGLVIGLVSSLLGVAGGEFIIPTLVFVFGADIKAAGTGSLLISLPVVAVGVVRYARQGAYAERQDLWRTVAPMGAGSIIGAAVGGLLVGLVPTGAVKVVLGLILLLSAFRTFRHP
jgi:hypothetical protein